MRSLFLTVLILTISSINAGWVRFYGGEGRDQARCIQQTSDDCYIVTGYWRFMKLNNEGDTIWTRSYDRKSGVYCIESKDNHYVISGTYGTDDLWVFKMDALGEKKWELVYEGLNEVGYSIQETNDNCYAVLGTAILKVNNNGALLWSKEPGGVGRFGIQTSDNGFIMSGQAGWSLWLYKTDTNGDQLWSKGYAIGDIGYCIHKAEDQGYMVLSNTKGDNVDILLMKTDENGDSLWSRTYGGAELENGRHFHLTSDGGFIIAGYTYSYGQGGADFWLVKTNNEGDIQWERTYGGLEDDYCHYVQLTDDGGFVMAGETQSFSDGSSSYECDYLIIKTDSLGRVWPIEISPTKLFAPTQDVKLTEMIPKARFTNLSTCNYNGDIYCHFEIVGIDHHGADRHDSVLVHGLKAWESVDLEFSEWSSDHISAYKATFYVTSTTGDSIPCHPLSVTFFRGSEVEEQAFVAPSLELITSVGSQIILRYSDCPQGFAATVFDASGRKVDELYSTQQSGTITWGKEYLPGVYFIRSGNSETKTQKLILIR